MWTPDYFVKFVELPIRTEGCTIPNPDGSFEIYINSLLCEKRQKEKLKHELEHIREDHFYQDCKNIFTIESEANKTPVAPPTTPEPDLLDVFFNPPSGQIACFKSLDAMTTYIQRCREQRLRKRAAGG